MCTQLVVAVVCEFAFVFAAVPLDLQLKKGGRHPQ
jgi:hypothetical protein